MGAQAPLQAGEQPGQVQAVALVGVIGLHVADDAFRGVHGQAAEVVQGPGFAGLDGNARIGVGGAVVGLVAEQTRLFVPGAQPLAWPAGPHGPNRVWVGDITYLPRQGGGGLYLAVWLDRCARKIVGWDVRDPMPEDLVSEALRRALAVRQPPAGLVIHSDQGCQYTATRFKDLVVQHGAVQSMSRRGNCYDNALPGTTHAESFWGRFKAELLDGGRFPGLAEAKLEISHHIAYYNAERRHSSLGYLAPTTSKSTFKQRSNSVRLS